MENASKALIIAGAILLSILLISLGIMIFNQASNTVTNSGMTEAEITAINNRFTKYEGTQTGTMVKAMIQEVLAYNSSLDMSHGDNRIFVNASAEPKTKDIINNTKYNVTIEYSTTTGLVYKIQYQ